MDPLSVTASVVAVIQATYEVIAVCQSYNAARQSSTWELPRVIAELKDVRDVLASLETLAEKAESGDPTAEHRLPQLRNLCQPDHGALHLCWTEIQALREKLAPPKWVGKDGSKRADLFRAMAWPLQEASTKKVLEKLERYRNNISLALNVDMAGIALSTHDSTKVIRQDLLSVDQNVDDLQRSLQSMAVDSLLERVNNWLTAPDPWPKYKEILKRRHLGTGAWLVKDSERFFDWRSQSGSFLWLHGIPGCGKTVLSCTVIEGVLDYCNLASLRGLAFYFFDFREDETQGVGNLLRALLKQFSRQLPVASQDLQSLYQSAQAGGRQPTIDELLVTLHKMLQHFDDSFIIMDALDECSNREERDNLFETLAEIERWDQIRLHILVTSRPETDIKSAMEDGTAFRQAIPIDSQLVQDDIRSYVRNRLQQDTRLKRWRNNAQIQGEIENVLTEKSNGMFQWASCQLDSLGKCLNLPMLRKTLATLPKTLNQTYERILLKIDDEYATYAKRFMKWLAYSARPLQLKELAEIVTVELTDEPRVDPLRRLPDPEDVLTICSSLVAVKQSVSVPILQLTEPEDMANPQLAIPDKIDDEVENDLDDNVQEDGLHHFEVTLAHFSVKEYLISTDIQTGPVKDFAVTEMDASYSIAETCLAYLIQFNARSTLTHRAIWRFPLALYAAQHWPSHYKDAKGEGGLLMKLATELLCSGAFFHCVSLYHPITESSRFGNFRTRDRRFLPLHYTCAHGMTDLVKCVLGERAEAVVVDGLGDINAVSDYGSALAIASSRGHLNTVKVLLDEHAKVDLCWGQSDDGLLENNNIKGEPILAHRYDRVFSSSSTSTSPLYNACHEGHETIVRLLLDSNADANLAGGHYGTPLHVATVTQNEGIVRILLDRKVNLEISVEPYGTALHIASSAGLESIARLLLDKGADINVGGGEHGNALRSASAKGHTSVVRLLLDRGADVNIREDKHGYALQAASIEGHESVVRLLLEEGANVNAGGDEEGNALQSASASGHEAVARLLLEHGANVNILGGRFGSPLGAAIAYNRVAVVGVLLDAGADVNLSRGVYHDESVDRYTAFQPHLHTALEHPNIMQLLLEKGARANARNTARKTALSAALEAEASPGSVSVLLDNGASLFLLDDTDMKRFNKLRPKLGLGTVADEDRKDD